MNYECLELFLDQQLKFLAINGGLVDKIIQEHRRQIEKWGVQSHSIFTWLGFAMEELGETSEAISEYQFRDGSRENVVKEAIETATLMLKIAEMFMDD